MFIVVESGATKTAWRAVCEDGSVRAVQTAGLSPTCLDLEHTQEIVRKAMDQSEPSLITRHTTSLAQAYNKYYFEHRIMDETDAAGTAARLALTAAVRDVIKTGLWLIGIEAPERM